MELNRGERSRGVSPHAPVTLAGFLVHCLKYLVRTVWEKNDCHGMGELNSGTGACICYILSSCERQGRKTSGTGGELDNWLVSTVKTEERKKSVDVKEVFNQIC